MKPTILARLAATMLSIAGTGLFGAGCAHGLPPVPASARQIHVGQGGIQARAHSDGRVWVVDDTDHRTIWAGDVHVGDMIVLRAFPDAEGTVSVNGDVKIKQNLSPGDRYVVYENP